MDRRSVSQLTVDELIKLVADGVAERILRRMRLPAEAPPARLSGEADRQWGFRFGVDGAIDEKEVRRLLGGVGGTTVDRRVSEGRFRRGKDGRRVVFCQRSVMDYLASLEQ